MLANFFLFAGKLLRVHRSTSSYSLHGWVAARQYKHTLARARSRVSEGYEMTIGSGTYDATATEARLAGTA